jgi:hypothetical protein
MANKRIELEQYKHYVDLLEEEPNRKTWRKGVQIVMITAMLLALAMFVLGLMSGSLASNPRNILEKPPAKTTAPDTGTDQQNQPIQQNLPLQDSGQQQLPEGLTIPNQSKAPGAPGLPRGAGDGALLAQAVTTLPAEPSSAPFTGTDTQAVPSSSAPADSQKAAKAGGPGEQTTGVGNLSNLTNGAGGRGLQIYLLVLFVGLCIFLYLPIRKVRLEGKSK